MTDQLSDDFQMGRIEELNGALLMLEIEQQHPRKDSLSELAKQFRARLETVKRAFEAQSGSRH